MFFLTDVNCSFHLADIQFSTISTVFGTYASYFHQSHDGWAASVHFGAWNTCKQPSPSSQLRYNHLKIEFLRNRS